MSAASHFAQVFAFAALAATGCGKAVGSGGPGRVSFSASAAPRSTALGAAPAICARFSLQPYALDATGKVTLAGLPATFASSAVPGPPLAVLGCADDPAVSGDDWGYFVTADQFNDCALAPAGGNPVAGLSPSVVSKSYPLDCRAGQDVSLDVSVEVYLVQPGPDGYADLTLGVDVDHQLVGCKNAEIVGDTLRFGEVGSFAANGGSAPRGFTGVGLTGPTGASVPLAGDPLRQFAGVIRTGADTMGAYYTGVLPVAQPGIWQVLQGFAQECAPGEYYSRTQAPRCETVVDPQRAPPVSTSARLADVFVTVPGRGWIWAEVSGLDSVDLTSGPDARLSDATAGGRVGWNPSTLRQRLAFGQPVAGLYVDRQSPGALLVILSGPAGPLLRELALDAASGSWQPGPPLALASLSSAQLSSRGVFEKINGACTRLP